MGRKPIDLTGLKFHMLTAVRNTGAKICHNLVWEWRCECGNLHRALASHVRSGSTKSCGCYRANKSVVSAGERYGRLVAVVKSETKQRGGYLWEFLCDCGETVLLQGDAVFRGRQKSCGCLQREGIGKSIHGHCAKNLAQGGDATPIYRAWIQVRS